MPPPQGDMPSIFLLEPLNSIDLFEITIPELQDHLSNGSFTSKELVMFCLERIHHVDPYLEAVIQTNPDALKIAESMDDERAKGNIRGPLHGIPVMNIATKDKMATTCGSWALLGSTVPRDAFVVAQLRKAGAVIIAHTNMSEWASTRSSGYSDGYSARGGQCRNTYHLSRSPFGSSGGPAVAVAANYVPLTFGTETDGSIVGPSQANAVVGIKPTPGLVPRSGVIPVSYSMDTVGPIARTVRDAVIGLNVIAGVDERDPLTSTAEVRETDFFKYLSSKEALKGARFGLPMKGCWECVEEDQKAVVQPLFDAIRAAGAGIIPVEYPCAKERISEEGKWNWELGPPNQCEFTVVKTEAYNGMKSYLAELGNTNLKTLEDIIEYNKDNKGTEGADPGDHVAFPSGQDLFERIAEHKGVKDQDYHDALSYTHRKTREEGIDAALTHNLPDGTSIQLDALLFSDGRLVGQQIAAQAGYPTITIPVGVDNKGMPVGINLGQSAWKEGVLVKWASAIEDLRNDVMGGRPLPLYRDHLAKNIPIGVKRVKEEEDGGR